MFRPSRIMKWLEIRITRLDMNTKINKYKNHVLAYITNSCYFQVYKKQKTIYIKTLYKEKPLNNILDHNRPLKKMVHKYLYNYRFKMSSRQ